MYKDLILQHTFQERKFWASVMYHYLRDALSCPCVSPVPERKRRNRSHHIYRCSLDALNWIKSDDIWVGSFVWICELLDFEPDKIREELNSGSINKHTILKITLNYKRKARNGGPQEKTKSSRSKKSSGRTGQKKSSGESGPK